MRDALALWAEPGDLTDIGPHGPLPLRGEPVARAVGIAQGLLRHDTVAESLYGHRPAADRAADIHVRSARQLLDSVMSLDPSPITVPRADPARVLGRCRTHAVLTVALLRSGGIPARARCGFASYFAPGHWEDHWVVEHWSDVDARWVVVDPQLDPVWREHTGIAFDPLDLPAGAFLPAGVVWQRLRRGEIDAERCGLSSIDLRGAWFVAGNVVRDLAALTKQELLPWDVWGAMPAPGPVEEQTAARLDRWAELSCDPDARFFDLLTCITDDDGVRVPDVVHNVGTGRDERWLP